MLIVTIPVIISLKRLRHFKDNELDKKKLLSFEDILTLGGIVFDSL